MHIVLAFVLNLLLFYLASFFLSFSSSSSFWADVRLSASARLSTAIAKKTFSRISVQRELRKWRTCAIISAFGLR